MTKPSDSSHPAFPSIEHIFSAVPYTVESCAGKYSLLWFTTVYQLIERRHGSSREFSGDWHVETVLDTNESLENGDAEERLRVV